MEREEVALRILIAMLRQRGDVSTVGENEIRFAFNLAKTFEDVSSDVGTRPARNSGRRPRPYEDEED